MQRVMTGERDSRHEKILIFLQDFTSLYIPFHLLTRRGNIRLPVKQGQSFEDEKKLTN